jgi:flagellin-like protein
MKQKRGLSPVVATVLLIAVVIVIGLIVFLWFRGITEEAITKFDGTNVKLVCDDVFFEASYSGETVFIKNTGNVPIFKIKAQISTEGTHSTEFIGKDGNWPELGLNQGGVYSGSITPGNSIILIPVLLGRTNEGERTYTCDERHGIELYIN